MSNEYNVSVEYGSAQGKTDTVQPKEFDRFAELAKKLVEVPKAEVDKKRASKKS